VIDAKCALHPDVHAASACDRCGTFACSECLTPDEGRSYCAKCYAMVFRGPPSALAQVSAMLGVIGFCGYLPAVAALVTSSIELGRIERGESPIAGRNWARSGRAMGWIYTALLLIVIAAAVCQRAQ
jgi:hypothetical protein